MKFKLSVSKYFPITIGFYILGSMNIAVAQQESNEEVMSEFLDIVSKNAYEGASVNWDSIRPLALTQASETIEKSKLYPIFKQIIKQLDDVHSSVLFAENSNQGDKNEILRRYATTSHEEAGIPFPDIKGKIIENKYAYVNVPSVVLEHKKYVQLIGEQIALLDQQNPKAWIFDVSSNNGGSIVPMLWQFYAFIDQDKIYSTVDGRGKEQLVNRAIWNNPNASEEELMFMDLTGLSDKSLNSVEVKNNKLPIYILTSNKTASSGEFFVAAFKGQKNVKVIGQTTNGLTSSNEVFPIGAQYIVNLMTSVLKDREGKIYKIKEGIKPDVELPSKGKTSSGSETLSLLDMALEHINSLDI